MLTSTFLVAMIDNWIHQLCEFIFKRRRPQSTTESEEQLVQRSLASSLESKGGNQAQNKPIMGKITKIVIGLLLHSILTGMSIGMRDTEDEILAGLLAIIPHKLTVLIVLSTMTLEINRISRFVHILLFSIAMPIGFLLSIGSFQKFSWRKVHIYPKYLSFMNGLRKRTRVQFLKLKSDIKITGRFSCM